ncbi:MAG: hypothetical protein RBS80_08485 [Thermoguttaceae bacterium]|nr:hypothetical protein [Thermoguttaceae bacterium]
MRIAMLGFVLGRVCLATAVAAEPVVLFDFTQGSHEWVPAHDVANMRVTEDGLEFDCTGRDPYIVSGLVERLPLGSRVLLTIRMRSEADPVGEVFFGRTFTAQNAVRFTVINDGQWHEYEIMLPPQEDGARLRIDPAASQGPVAIAWIKATDLKPLTAGELPPPVTVDLGKRPRTVQAGDLSLVHGGEQWEGFGVWVDGQEMARAHGRPQLGVILDGKPVYLDLAAAKFEVLAEQEGVLRVAARIQDAGGAKWTLRREFAARGLSQFSRHSGQDTQSLNDSAAKMGLSPSPVSATTNLSPSPSPALPSSPGPSSCAIDIKTEVTVDQPRAVFHLPVLTLLPGLGTFGEAKTQAVLPGVEYLEDEPSSSEADVRGPNADRRIVENHKLCFPMMSVVAKGRYVGLIWDCNDRPAAVFDSPDRVFRSGSHLMGLWLPGVGEGRLENELEAFRPLVIEANAPLPFTATLIGGRGETVNPAVEQYVRLSGGLPPAPEYEGGFEGTVKLLAHGWLASALHEDGTWRHAVWGDQFPARPAADAPGYMLWLAEHTADKELAGRLRAGADRGLERLGPGGNWDARCSHVARPFAPLLFGQIEPYAERRLAAARRALGAFDDQGLIRYRPQPDKPDYGATHWEDHANGLSAARLEPILEAAALTGDVELTTAALAVLDKQLAVYRNTVPRGAQTWEMPLHTPDILAAGRMVACCNLAYQLTGDARYLDAARNWAWTGVSMVYLDPPTDRAVGLYATTAVLGATNWTAPFWIGLPVQWCGLVYRSALQDLAQLDGEMGEFWSHLAVGITRSGLQQTFPLTDPQQQGLLPDYFHLREQKPGGPAISPGTVQANVAEAYGKTPIYTLRRLSPGGMLVHVPGGIGRVERDGAALRIEIDGWYSKPYWVRLVLVPAMSAVVELEGGRVLDVESEEEKKTLNVLVEGKGPLVLSLARILHDDVGW